MTFSKVGDTYKNFQVTKIVPIPEIQITLLEIKHIPSGATICHLVNDDTENLFSLSFRTLPKSSNGAPHILEHIVLCGSKKFPVKDPFFAMLRRSLNTFMNAFTGSDFTCYPASSQVEKDFYNLLEVYLDAVFHPQIKKLSFLQEGWRLEFSDPHSSDSPLLYKGVVYNEMKGAQSSPENRFWHEMMKRLCPDLTYSHVSGGDPKEIPSLSYEELVKFHKTYYHPSSCLFFFYGNIPTEKHLDFLEKNAFTNLTASPSLEVIPKQKRFTSPVQATGFFPIASQESLAKKTMVAFGWLTTSIQNQEDILALSLLDSILMDTDASPLKRALLKSGLCQEVDLSFDTEISEAPWILVCKGCEEKDASKLYQVIESSLKKFVSQKIDPILIEGALHQLEFSRYEISGESFPYGLTLFFRSALAKQHGCRAEDALAIHSLFATLHEKLQNPHYLPSILEKYILQNPHRVDLIMKPDPQLEKKEADEEKSTLKNVFTSLSEEQKKEIQKSAQELLSYQKEMENQSLDCLPRLQMKDVPMETKNYLLTSEKKHNIHWFHHNVFTNRILYLDVVFDLPPLSWEEYSFLPFFADFLTEVGCGGRGYEETLSLQQLYTGGIEASLSQFYSLENPKKSSPVLVVRGKALENNIPSFLQLLQETLTSPSFQDMERIKELLMQEFAEMEQSLTQSAMRFAIKNSLAPVSEGSTLDNLWHGLGHVQTLRSIVKNIDIFLPKLIHLFATWTETLLRPKKIDVVCSCDEEAFAIVKNHPFSLETSSFAPKPSSIEIPRSLYEGYTIASPVAFSALAYSTIGYKHKDAPALMVASALLEHIYLHKEIREQGGAYGSRSSYLANVGAFYFQMYRDPHIHRSVQICLDSMKKITSHNIPEQDLEEAKLSILQDLDTPIPPGRRALTAYGYERTHKTHALRSAFRKAIIELTSENVQQAVSHHLLSLLGTESFTTFASPELLEKEKKDVERILQKSFTLHHL